MVNLGSFAAGFFTFMLLAPVRTEGGGIPSCLQGSECRELPTHCYTVAGWEDVLGPFSCSLWAVFAAAVVVGYSTRAIGLLRDRAKQSDDTRGCRTLLPPRGPG